MRLTRLSSRRMQRCKGRSAVSEYLCISQTDPSRRGKSGRGEHGRCGVHVTPQARQERLQALEQLH